MPIDEIVRSYRPPVRWTAFTLAEAFGDDPELPEHLEKLIKKDKSEHRRLMKFEPVVDPELRWVRQAVNQHKADSLYGARIKLLERVLEIITAPKSEVTDGRITDEQIARAREYPITNFIEFRRGFASCPWHAENTGSLHLLPNTNETRAHCHGACGRSYDGIDAYMNIYKCNFATAVKALAG